MKKCIINNCDKSSKAHGYCSAHYHRLIRYGNPLKGKDFRNRNPPDNCTIFGCNHKYAAKGLCYMHYQRQRSNGDPITTRRNPDGEGSIKSGYHIYRVNKKMITTHRKIMEDHIGRKLLPFPQEVVHHIDGNKLNNHISNLQLMSASEHMKLHYNQGDIGHGIKTR